MSLPPGKRIIEITNAGADWFYLDSVRLEHVLPASYSNDWQPSCEAIGLRGPHESLVYIVAPQASFPGGAADVALPLQHGQTVSLTNWTGGTFSVNWYDPASGTSLGLTKAVNTNGSLVLPLPDFTEDLAGVLYAPPTLTAVALATNAVQLRLDSETSGRYTLEQSSDLFSWSPLANVTNLLGTMILTEPFSDNTRLFFRAAKAN